MAAPPLNSEAITSMDHDANLRTGEISGNVSKDNQNVGGLPSQSVSLLASGHHDRSSDATSIPSLDGTFDSFGPNIGPRGCTFETELLSGYTMPKPVAPTPLGLTSSGACVFTNNTPSIKKVDLQSAMSTNLAPKSGVLPSQQRTPTDGHDKQETESNPDFRTRIIPPVGVSRTVPDRESSTSSEKAQQIQSANATVEVATHSSPMPPPPREPKTSARRVKNYKLADGTIVSGKGLGRGRPGIKRGPRNSKYNVGDEIATPFPTYSFVSGPQSTNSPMNKRKRSDSDSSNVKTQRSASTSTSFNSRESSVEYTPVATETRSGRKTQKPVQLVPQAPEVSSPATKKPRVDSATPAANPSPSTIKTHPKIKRRIYRGREQLALCEHCLRGHGPPGNAIVFCDACNKCWHQRCHDPQVPKEIVSDAKADWFCAECDRILHGKKGKKGAQSKGSVSSTNATPVKHTEPIRPSFAGPLIGGAGMPKEHKVAYLNSLSKEGLISLILGAADLAPALPLFQALVPPPAPVPQAQFTSNYVTPVSRPPTFAAAQDIEIPDDGYDEYFDEHAALYPKPGNGVKLPPESADMHLLLESRYSRTFSHWVRGMHGRDFSGTGNLVEARA